MTTVVAENLQQRRYGIASVFNRRQIFIKFPPSREININFFNSARRYMQTAPGWVKVNSAIWANFCGNSGETDRPTVAIY